MSDRPGDVPGEPGAPGSSGGAPDGAPDVHEPADPRTNTLVKLVLRTGLAVSLVAVAVGLVVQLATGRHEAVPVKMFGLASAPSVGETIMAVGVLALALTPAVGVLTVVGSWVRERDARFVAVGGVVIAVLAAAIVVGFA